MQAFWWLLIPILVLFPMAMLKPSLRQKQIIDLRNLVRGLGIQVKVLPKEVQAGLKLEGVNYVWLRPLDAPKLQQEICLVRKQETEQEGAEQEKPWQEVSGKLSSLKPKLQQELLKLIENLPADAFAVELTSSSLGFWWHELKPDAKNLEQQLTSLSQQAEVILSLN